MTTENETQTNETQSGNALTTVKTVYARAAILLLAANFCLTGYCLVKLTEAQGFQSSSGATPTFTTGKKAPTLSLDTQIPEFPRKEVETTTTESTSDQ